MFVDSTPRLHVSFYDGGMCSRGTLLFEINVLTLRNGSFLLIWRIGHFLLTDYAVFADEKRRFNALLIRLFCGE